MNGKRIAVIVRHTTQSVLPDVPIDKPLRQFVNFHVFNFAVYLNRYIEDAEVEFYHFTLQKKYFIKEYKGIKIHFCPVHLFPLKYGYETSFTLFSKLKVFNPDFIVTSNYGNLSFTTLLLWAKLHNVPIITTHSSSVASYKRPRNPFKIVRYFLFNFLMKKYLDGIIIWGHNPIKDFFTNKLKLPEKKIYDTAWIGADHNFFKPGSKNNARKRLNLNYNEICILNVCILLPPSTPKSQFHLVDILEELSKIRDISEIKCILVGSKDMGENLKQKLLTYIESKKMKNNFIIFDFISNETLLDIYHASDFYVNLSYKDSGLLKKSALERETPIIESAAVRLPTLSFAHVSISENDGRMIYVPKDNNYEMAYQLHNLIDDSKTVEQLKENAYQDFIEHASWKKVSQNIYDTIILPIMERYESTH